MTKDDNNIINVGCASIIIVVVILIVIGLLWIILTSNGCRTTYKNIKSDLGNGLHRKVVVTNVFGLPVWSYDGLCYIKDSSTSGNITITTIDDDGVIKKNDFIGNYNLQAIEK